MIKSPTCPWLGEGNSRIQAEQEGKRREEEESDTVARASPAQIHSQKKKGKLKTTSMAVKTQRRKGMKRRKMEH